MAKIELSKECPDELHVYLPIIEGGQTVGIKCCVCDKTVREDMEHTSIVVTDRNEILNLDSIIPQTFDQHYRRKDKRF